MATPHYKYHREPPRRLTTARTEVNATTTMVAGLPDVNLFSRPQSWLRGVASALLATAVFRCWHFILFFTAEATVVTYFYMHHGDKWLGIESTLMNVLGTVLGFVISYRSSASFDRYNEGRRYWSQVVYNIRMFARTVWLHVPDGPLDGKTLHPARTEEEYRARNHVEKKTVLNLLEAFAVSLKHYLRGEEGVHYEDLFPLVRFLPAYRPRVDAEIEWPSKRRKGKPRTRVMSPRRDHLTVPTSDNRARTPSIEITPSQDEKHSTPMRKGTTIVDEEAQTIRIAPSRNPPPFHIFDIWPFYLCIRSIQKRGRKLKGQRALRDRAQNKNTKDGVENVPLEITLYLSRYIASLQQRNLDGLTGGQMMGALSQLVDALTGLERILSTPVPWAYSIHLWTVTLVWLVVLPFQVLKTLGWLTIPGVSLAAFVYCGLMKCAEELEDPFGYDYNDLNLDHFTHNIIRRELQAITALPMPDPVNWAFAPDNDAVFDRDGNAIYMYEEEDQKDFGYKATSPGENLAPVRSQSSETSNAILGGTNVMHQSPGNSFATPSGGPGGAGLVAGGAVAAAGINAIDTTSMMSSSPPPPPPTGI